MPRWNYKTTGMRRPLGGRMLGSTLQITEINGPLLSTLSNQFVPSFRGWFPGGGAIGTPSLDVAMDFPHSSLSKSLTIPAQLAAAAGEGRDGGFSCPRSNEVAYWHFGDMPAYPENVRSPR